MNQTGAPLQEAIGEPTGGGANVDTDKARRIDSEVIQRGLQLESPAADILFPHGETDVRIGCHGSPRLGDWLAFNKDLPSHHSPRGLIHSWKKTAFNK
jgi:hypothetical protein